MKLKTKFQDEDFELGEVTDADVATMPDGRIKLQAKAKAGGLNTFFYDRLEKIYSEWEDYEEPKEFWFIDEEGIIRSTNEENWPEESVVAAKSIGDYFETKEEAEKAVEKLKAFKRLKDKGFRFDGWDENHHNLGIVEFSFTNVKKSVYDFSDDLGLLFGGKE